MPEDVRRYHESFEDTVTRQTQWVEGSGILLIVAIYLGGIGAAAYAASIVVGLAEGVIVGWFLAVVGKGTFHVLFLGRPARFWRAAARPNSSWLSRGFWALILFSVVGTVAALPAASEVIPGFPHVNPAVVTPAIPVALALAAFLVVYDGFLVGANRGIPFWNSGLMPLLIPTFSLLAGVTLVAFVFLGLGLVDHPGYETIHTVEPVVLVIASGVLAASLVGVRYGGETSRRAVDDLVTGRGGPYLLAAVALIIVAPFVLLAAEFVGGVGVPLSWYAAVSLLAVVGEFFYKYSLLRAGYYPPLLGGR